MLVEKSCVELLRSSGINNLVVVFDNPAFCLDCKLPATLNNEFATVINFVFFSEQGKLLFRSPTEALRDSYYSEYLRLHVGNHSRPTPLAIISFVVLLLLLLFFRLVGWAAELGPGSYVPRYSVIFFPGFFGRFFLAPV